MQNTLRLNHDNLRKSAVNTLVIYIIFSTVFEWVEGMQALNTVTLYLFGVIGMLYIVHKKGIVGFSNGQLTVRVLIFMLAFVSLLWIPESITSISTMYLYRYFTTVIICFIVINIVYSKKDVEKILLAYVIGGAFLSVSFYITYGSQILTLYEKVEEYERLGREFGNLNEVAQRCLFAYIAGFYFVLKDGFKKHRLLHIINIALCFSVILFTASKKAFFISFVAAAAVFWLHAKNMNVKNKLKILVIGILLVLIMLYAVINISVFANIRSRVEVFFATLSGDTTQESLSDLNRINFIKEGLGYYIEHWFVGGGICYTNYLFGTYSHNNYVEMLVNFGTIGFLIYYAGYIINIRSLRRLKACGQENIKDIFRVFMIAFLFIDIGIVTYYNRYICIILSVINAYFTNRVSDRDENGILQ